MNQAATAAPTDPQSSALARMLCQLCEDALYTFSAGAGVAALEDIAKRRHDAYVAVLSGQRIHTLQIGRAHV